MIQHKLRSVKTLLYNYWPHMNLYGDDDLNVEDGVRVEVRMTVGEMDGLVSDGPLMGTFAADDYMIMTDSVVEAYAAGCCVVASSCVGFGSLWLLSAVADYCCFVMILMQVQSMVQMAPDHHHLSHGHSSHPFRFG